MRDSIMNLLVHFPHGGHHWLKDLQFAVGIVVAVGGAAVVLGEVAQLLS
jgi:hypothetical protein